MCTVVGNSIEMAELGDVCFRCKKPVYFAERKSSLGKQWHRECLRCDQCNKVLNPGQHAEHKGTPFCHNPCYQTLYGPKITGYGITCYSHTEFGTGNMGQKNTSFYKTLQRQDILDKLKHYNSCCQGSMERVKYTEINGRIVMEVRLRVYWRVAREIQLLDSDETHGGRYSSVGNPSGSNRRDSEERRSHSMSFQSSRTLPMSFDKDQAHDAVFGEKRSRNSGSEENDTCTVVMRPGNQQVHYYRRSINGHCFDGPSQVKIMPDTKTAVRISNEDTTNEVIYTLLQKFKVQEKPEDFGLFLISKDGFERRLMPQEVPLLEKLSAGPQDENAKFILKEKNANAHLSEGVCDLMALSMDMLNQMIDRIKKEEEDEKALIMQKYENLRSRILAYLSKRESVV